MSLARVCMCTQQRAKWTFPSFPSCWFAAEMEVCVGLIFTDSGGLLELLPQRKNGNF